MNKLLVTGFGQFPGVPFNLSEALVRRWQREPPSWPGALRCEVLPTIYAQAAGRLEQLLGEYQPDCALLFGVGGSQCTLRLERVALNIDDAAIPDAAGDLRQGSAIEAGAPLAQGTALDLPALHGQLLEAGVGAEISNHAGTYVCNHGYYAALSAAARLPRRCRVLFVHVPDAAKLPGEAERAALTERVAAGAAVLFGLLAALP